MTAPAPSPSPMQAQRTMQGLAKWLRVEAAGRGFCAPLVAEQLIRWASEVESAQQGQPASAVAVQGAINYCCYAAYCEAGHSDDCKNAAPVQASVAPSDDAPCERDECWLHEKCIGLCARAATAPSPPPSEAGQPVAWRWREACNIAGRLEWGDWRHEGFKPKGPASDTFEIEPLYTRAALASLTAAAPADQRMPLSEERINELAQAHTWFNGSHAMTNFVGFARAIEQEAKNAVGVQQPDGAPR